MDYEFRFGLKKRIYNYNLKWARENQGLTMRELAKRAGCSVGYLYNIQAFKVYPGPEVRERLAIALEVPVDSIFPEEISDFRLLKSAGTIDDCTITLSEAREIEAKEGLLYGEGWENEVESDLFLPKTISAMLGTLKPQEETIIRERFGLDSGHALTLRAVGEKHGVTPERIRQIEAKGLRKLRHPARSKHLKDFV